ncbi:FtsX-like permease family protein, partial [Clostridioides difficile]|uniref:FtsX-like permease family protein n=1 Tax=Clostridioides difficile TaxID=1496 RepID=UPI0020B2AA63
RYKEFGILYITGISKRQVMKLIFIENMIINIVSSVIGIIIGLTPIVSVISKYLDSFIILTLKSLFLGNTVLNSPLVLV